MAETDTSGPTGLTDRQRRVLNFIAAFMASEGSAPTLETIRSHLGVAAVSTVHEHVSRLIEKGYLERRWNRARSIALAPPGLAVGAMRLVPVVGTVSSGGYIESGREKGEVGVPLDLAKKTGTYALRVRGNALGGEGIRNGDTLVVEEARSAGAGRLVVVTAGTGSVLAKMAGGTGYRVEPLGSGVRARAGWAWGKMGVRGVVVGLLRRYR